MLEIREQGVRVQVPASSANLGPGYDSFGLALGIYDEIVAQRAPSGLSIDVAGVGAATLPRDATHLVVRSAAAAFAAMAEPVPGLVLRCRNAIPHGSGQGSSAAAIVGGILLARALTPDGANRLPDAAALRLAARLEGHPDNVAAALLGGFTIAWTPAGDRGGAGAAGTVANSGDETSCDPVDLGGARAVRLSPHPDVRAVLLTTERSCATKTARSVLPESIPHGDAAVNSARAALLVHAITTDPSLLFEATVDRLHQRYRASVMPESIALLDRLRAAGVAAVLSGAGPTVMALGTHLPKPESLSHGTFRATPVTLSAVGAAPVPA